MKLTGFYKFNDPLRFTAQTNKHCPFAGIQRVSADAGLFLLSCISSRTDSQPPGECLPLTSTHRKLKFHQNLDKNCNNSHTFHKISDTVLTFYVCIQGVHGSNLRKYTGYTGLKFLVVFICRCREVPGNALFRTIITSFQTLSDSSVIITVQSTWSTY